MDRTEKLTNIGSNIITILTGLIALIPIFKSSYSILQDGLKSQIPAYWIPITGVTSLLLGWLMAKKITINKSIKSEIKFHTSEPTKHGWILEVDPNYKKPQFSLLVDDLQGKYLSIKSYGGYYMDYKFKPYQYSCRKISFIANLRDSSLIHVGIKVYCNSTNKEEELWMQIDYRGEYQKPHLKNVKDNEWIVFGALKSLKSIEKNWSKVTLDVKRQLSKIKIKEDCKFIRLDKIRFRGSFGISRIELS